MPRWTLPKKLLGDHCHPPFASFTRFVPSVDRSPSAPVVRYEVWNDSAANPGKTGSALFSKSGLLRNRCHQYEPVSRCESVRLKSSLVVGAYWLPREEAWNT